MPEMNTGQLRMLLRSQFLVDIQGIQNLCGRSFFVEELAECIEAIDEGGYEMTDVALPTYKAKDFATDQDVRWCPGCGDYAVLTAMKKMAADLGVKREDFMYFVSGIGCAARFPYYMNTYGAHTIHGRSPAFATGVKIANPDLEVFLISGDGDLFSIGGNHTMHALASKHRY